MAKEKSKYPSYKISPSRDGRLIVTFNTENGQEIEVDIQYGNEGVAVDLNNGKEAQSSSIDFAA